MGNGRDSAPRESSTLPSCALTQLLVTLTLALTPTPIPKCMPFNDWVDTSIPGSETNPEDQRCLGRSGARRCRACRCASCWRRRGLKHVNVFSLDVEGAELAVLRVTAPTTRLLIRMAKT